MSIDNLVIITGAGASRRLGAENRDLPCMPEWNNLLRTALDAAGGSLAELVGIRHGQTGEQFEAAVGDFLRWKQFLPLSAKYLPMGWNQADRIQDDVKQWEYLASSRAKQALETIYTTLHEQFGRGVIRRQAAKDAYAQLLDSLSMSSGHTITVATTNYDNSARIALQELGLYPDVGEQEGPGGHRVLRPEGLLDRCFKGHSTPLLNLHGTVGWWTQADDTVRALPDGSGYDSSMTGVPTVVLPDPDKDLTTLPAIRDLWNEFRLALGNATHVMFIGHSLNDRALVDYVIRSGRAVAVGAYTDDSASFDMAAAEAEIRSHIYNCTIVPMNFGPDLWVDAGQLAKWQK